MSKKTPPTWGMLSEWGLSHASPSPLGDRTVIQLGHTRPVCLKMKQDRTENIAGPGTKLALCKPLMLLLLLLLL